MKPLYGKQTEKAIRNFPFSAPPVHRELVLAIVKIKKAAALAHARTGELSAKQSKDIAHACDEILAGKHDDQFFLPSLQGGAGTSINMVVNEVVATLAKAHPNDHVNMSQSTNDVNPSALKIVAIELAERLIATVGTCIATFEQKAKEFNGVAKLGRTHLQDAVPVTLGGELAAYAATLSRDLRRLKARLPYLHELNLGGTAVGNRINASDAYIKYVYEELANITGLELKPADDLMSQTSSQTDFVSLSQAILSLTLDASKIANDLRLMSSGPAGGLGEIILEELQAGSSIMPGKVNPIMPETVNQLYYTVSGNNLTIEHAAHASFLELANMFPILADRLISSLKLSGEVLDQFTNQCIRTLRANEKRCRELLEKSTAYATLLSPILGYDTVSGIVKESVASGKSIRELVLAAKLMTENDFEKAIRI